MYICEKCGVCQQAKTPQHTLVLETREKQYPPRWVGDPSDPKKKIEIIDTGTEIVREIRICPTCNG